MKIRNVIWKIKHILYEVSEVLYLVMFSLILSYRFLGTTQFFEEWNILNTENKIVLELLSFFFVKPFALLGIITVLRYLCSKTYNIKQYLLAASLVFAAVLVFQRHDSMPYALTLILLLIGAKDISFQKLMRLYFSIVIFWSIITMVAAQLGIITNLVWNVEGRNIRISFGFIYPTDFAAHIFFMVLCYWYIRGERFHCIEAGITAVLGGFVYLFCEARCSTLMLLLLSLVMFYSQFRHIRSKKRNMEYQMCSVLSSLLVFVPLMCSAFIHFFSMFFTAGVKYMQGFNKLISGRLSLAKKAIDIFGFQLWGSDIPMVGNGSKETYASKYFYVDSTYLQLSLLYGVVFLTLILIVFLLVGEQARKRKDWILLWIIALASIHGVIEQHLIELEYFPFLFAAFADMSRSKKKRHGKKK